MRLKNQSLALIPIIFLSTLIFHRSFWACDRRNQKYFLQSWSNSSSGLLFYKAPDYWKLVPEQHTYMAAGLTRRKRDSNLNITIYNNLKNDNIHINTNYEVVMNYMGRIQKVKERLNATLLKKNIFELTFMGNIFPKDIQTMLKFWDKRLVYNSPYRTYTLGDVLHDLQLLSERPFPKTPRQATCKGCFQQDFQLLLEPKSDCKTSQVDDVDIIVIITSIPGAFRERKAVRESWGQWTRYQNSRSKLMFLFGGGWSEKENKQLLTENEQFGDILQADFKDHYYNLTYKVLMGYKWVAENYPGVKYIIRAADDTFVHLPNIRKLLAVYGSEPGFLDFQIGFCLYNVETPRFPWFKNHLTDNEYRKNHLPPYALGTIFMTSLNLTRDILKTSEDVPFFPIEDMYFGFLLTTIASGCHHVEGFYPLQANYSSDFYFGSHLETPERLHEIYKYFMGTAQTKG